MVEYNEYYDKELKDLVEGHPRTYGRVLTSAGSSGRYKDRGYLVEYVNRCTPLLSGDFYTLKTRLYWTLNHIEEFPKCVVCGKEIRDRNVDSLKSGYGRFCSMDCMYKSDEWNRKREDGLKRNYGTTSFFGYNSQNNLNLDFERTGRKISEIEELSIVRNEKRMKFEFEYFRNTKLNGEFPKKNDYNYIVKYFQQDIFYKVEKYMWRLPEARRWIVGWMLGAKDGRKEEDITMTDCLACFKRSGLFYGFSQFNPMWFKWFIERYGCRRCYDPCGGWGHRLLGSGDLETYIYNDLSKETKDNVDRMISYFDIKNVVTCCEDAASFRPKEDYDSIFTCPPYYNVEHYPCGDFKDYSEYERMMNGIYSAYRENGNCKVMGIVCREDLMALDGWTERIDMTLKGSNRVIRGRKKHVEYLYVFRK